MGYEFDNNTQYIDYGTHDPFYQASAAAGAWLYFLASVSDDKQILGKNDTFPTWKMTARTTLSQGYGVTAEHVIGGSVGVGVTCIPGQVASQYALPANQWMYFGFSRDDSVKAYYSYFGSRSALVDGPTATYGDLQHPLSPSTPGQSMGPWRVGGQANGVIVGPAHFWGRPLSKAEHLLMAQCTLPPSSLDLIWWVKMFSGALDSGPFNWTPAFAGTPLPPYVPDQGCGSFTQGQDYAFHVA